MSPEPMKDQLLNNLRGACACRDPDGRTCEQVRSVDDFCTLCLAAMRLEALSERDADREWRPIAAAPKDGTNLLVWCPDRRIPVAATWQTAEFCWIELYQGSIRPSHWMKLPEPPT